VGSHIIKSQICVSDPVHLVNWDVLTEAGDEFPPFRDVFVAQNCSLHVQPPLFNIRYRDPAGHTHYVWVSTMGHRRVVDSSHPARTKRYPWSQSAGVQHEPYPLLVVTKFASCFRGY
jgi:hypothetical protein